ncbi:MAG: enoyl-CoA hydratase/isomerase family protein [Bdellovibrionales bacterium]|nr:enoyl-CoA hydratase/isomerase family protein [Bdellovibrionales bacterium]
MESKAYDCIRREDRGGGVSILWVARAKALNALNLATLREMERALLALSADPEVRAVILTGEGEKAFIAGADIVEMKEMSRGEAVDFSKTGQAVTRLLQLMPKPTLAAVNGFALGGGTEMAISCDFIFASESARFGLPEVTLGVIPGFGGTARLAHFVGMPMAKELIFSGRQVRADEALRVGLVNRVMPAAELLAATVEFAQEVVSNSMPAVRSAKKLLNEFSESNGLHYKLDSEAQEFGNLFGWHDQREGMAAFSEKRKPAFEGVRT